MAGVLSSALQAVLVEVAFEVLQRTISLANLARLKAAYNVDLGLAPIGYKVHFVSEVVCCLVRLGRRLS